jgi:hypothetical protein
MHHIIISFFHLKTLSQKKNYEKVKVLGAMCKVIGIFKIIPQQKNGCFQRGANGKIVSHVLMK